MAEFLPLPAEPSNADLASGLTQLHSCLEDLKAQTLPAISQIPTISKKIEALALQDLNHVALASDLKKTHADLQASVNEVVAKVNPDRKRTILDLSPGQIFIRISGVMMGVSFIWKFFDFAAPYCLGFAHGIWMFLIDLDKWVRLHG